MQATNAKDMRTDEFLPRPFAVLVEPTPAWISVPSLLLFTGVVLFLASLHIRRMEISYAGD